MNKKRKDKIKNLAKEASKINIIEENKILKEIKKKYNKELKKYNYIDDLEKLKVGNYIKYINLEINKIVYGILINITNYDFSNGIRFITLKHTKNKNIWNLKPSKYYIFQKKNKNRSNLSKILDKYLESISSTIISDNNITNSSDENSD